MDRMNDGRIKMKYYKNLKLTKIYLKMAQNDSDQFEFVIFIQNYNYYFWNLNINYLVYY